MEYIESIRSLCASTEVNLVNSSLRLILALALGACVGAERKHKGQIAGIRTFALISMGACLAMLLSIYVPQVYMGLKNGDPSRIAAQVITGIGFLGGGAMIQMKGSVRGLTTAAGIWITAIIGMAIGVGMYVESVVTTVLILFVLVGIDQYEHRRRLGQESKVLNIKVHGIVEDLSPYSRLLARNGVKLSTFFAEYNYDKDESELNLVILIPVRYNLLPLIASLRELHPTKSINLSSQVDL